MRCGGLPSLRSPCTTPSAGRAGATRLRAGARTLSAQCAGSVAASPQALVPDACGCVPACWRGVHRLEPRPFSSCAPHLPISAQSGGVDSAQIECAGAVPRLANIAKATLARGRARAARPPLAAGSCLLKPLPAPPRISAEGPASSQHRDRSCREHLLARVQREATPCEPCAAATRPPMPALRA